MGRVALGLFPYALAYGLSYLLRSANAVLAEPLAQELGLAAASLGVLTALFYLAFALAQLPLGWVLDRWGPRWTLSYLMGVTALGCLLFGIGGDLPVLALGRAMMGAGMALSLVGPIRAYQLHAPRHLGALSGVTVAVGGLGGLLATVPLEAISAGVGWRGAFVLLAVLSLAMGALLLAAAPRDQRPVPAQGQSRRPWDPRLFLMGGVAFTYIGGFFAVQSLWAGAYAYHAGLGGDEVGFLLFVLNLSSVVGGLLAGVLASRYGTGTALFLGILVFCLGLVLWWSGLALAVAYALVGLGGGFNGLVLAHSTRLLPQLSGRDMALVNVSGVVGIFLLQSALGLAVDRAGYGPSLLWLALLQAMAAGAVFARRR